MNRIIRETVVIIKNHQMLSWQYVFILYKSYKAQTTVLNLNNVHHERATTKLSCPDASLAKHVQTRAPIRVPERHAKIRQQRLVSS